MKVVVFLDILDPLAAAVLLAGLLLLPPGLFIFYRIREFVPDPPFVQGLAAGLGFSAILLGAWYFLMPFLPGLPETTAWLWAVPALVRGGLLAAAVRLLLALTGRSREKWNYYVPLGLGFAWGEGLSLLPAVALAYPELMPGALYPGIVFLPALLYSETAAVLLVCLTGNRRKLRYLPAAILLGAAPLMVPWVPWLWLPVWLTGWLVVRLTRDAFSVFIKPGRNFKLLKRY